MRLGFRSLGGLLLVVVVAGVGGVEPHPDWENALAVKGKRGPRLTLATAGRTEYAILLPQEPAATEQRAAQELAHWLQQITGAAFPVLREDGSQRPGGAYVSLGGTALRAACQVPAPRIDFGRDGYAVQAAGQALFLSGGRRRGMVNAVYALLQEDLGCRWYIPGIDPVIPKRPTLTFRPVLRAYRPVFEDRRDPYYGDVAYDADWSIRNRTYALTAQVPADAGG